MDSEPDTTIAEALGRVLTVRFRRVLHHRLTEGIAGVTPTTYATISAVARAGRPLSAAEVAGEIGLDRSVVSRRAHALVQAGMLTVVANPSDSRQVLLELSLRGHDAIVVMRERLSAAVRQHIASWSETERRDFADLLDRFSATPL